MRSGGAQVASVQFFLRTLQWMQDDKTSIVLTPQVTSARHPNPFWALAPELAGNLQFAGPRFQLRNKDVLQTLFDNLQQQQQQNKSSAAFLHAAEASCTS